MKLRYPVASDFGTGNKTVAVLLNSDN